MKIRTIAILALMAIFVLSAFVPGASAAGGFDQYGYNDTARIFNGTGQSWCEAKGLSSAWCASYLGSSANDKLVMKWNAEWDRGNAEGWTDSNYNAWTDNEWNGMTPNGDQSVWHYKIKWVGACGPDGTTLADGGYCIWGQFDVVMDQGTVKQDGHYSFALASPNGYGSK